MGIIVDVDQDKVEEFGNQLDRIETLLQIVLAKIDPAAYQDWQEACALEDDIRSSRDRKINQSDLEKRGALLDKLLPDHKRPWEV